MLQKNVVQNKTIQIIKFWHFNMEQETPDHVGILAHSLGSWSPVRILQRLNHNHVPRVFEIKNSYRNILAWGEPKRMPVLHWKKLQISGQCFQNGTTVFISGHFCLSGKYFCSSDKFWNWSSPGRYGFKNIWQESSLEHQFYGDCKRLQY